MHVPPVKPLPVASAKMAEAAAVTDRMSQSRALQALTAAAMALPGMTAANAADPPSFNVQLGHFEDSKRELDGQSYRLLNLKPIRVDSFAVQGVIPLNDRLTVKGNFTQDSWSGATPVTTLPSAAVQAQLLSGASSPNFFHIDRSGTPQVVDFNNYDPSTETYAHVAHPGLVHIMASASPETRRQWDASISYEWDKAELSLGGGISDEHDFLSRFVNVGGKIDLNNKLTVVNWGGSYTWDRIRASIAANSAADTGNYVGQIRDYDGQPTIFGKRWDFALNGGITQILSSNNLVQADLSYTRSAGFLENPYKAVIFAFDDPSQPFDSSGLKYIPIKGSLEQRPDVRNQWAVNIRLAQHLASDGGLHLNYRYYRDDWGIRAHTLDLSLDQPLGRGWMVTPDVRYYSQSAANFYAPYFLFDQPYPAHPGGPLDRSKIRLKYFSSDERLSAFGAVSGSLALQKSLGRGLDLDLNYEYYLHKGALKLGGGGEPSYADFHTSLVTAGMSLDLARHADEQASKAGVLGGSVSGDILTSRPAGLLMPDVMRPGAWSISAGFSGTSWGGPVQFHRHSVSNDDLIANACGADHECTLGPIAAGSNALRLELNYAVSDAVTVSVIPTYVERSLTLVNVFPDFSPPYPLPPLGRPSGSGRHSASGWGDTGLLASFDLSPRSAWHVRVGTGLSIPTGESGRKLSGKSDFASYSLQAGSGTWDPTAVLDFEGGTGRLTAGAELSAVKRFGRNSAGYRLGDHLRADTWASAAITSWLSMTARLRFDSEGRIRGAYKDHLEHNVPFTELQQVDYDVNGDGVIDSNDLDYVTVYRDASEPHVITSPDDLAANHGGKFVDVGLGMTLRAPSGPFRSDGLSIEWLKPVSAHPYGYQLRRGATVNARVTIAI